VASTGAQTFGGTNSTIATAIAANAGGGTTRNGEHGGALVRLADR